MNLLNNIIFYNNNFNYILILKNVPDFNCFKVQNIDKVQ